MGIKLIGVKKLQVKLEKNMDLDKVRHVVQMNGSEMQRKAQRKSPVDTGTLKRGIGLEISDGGMTATVESTTEYAPYQEYGTRFMEAQPFMKPAFNEQKEKFKRDLKKLVK